MTRLPSTVDVEFQIAALGDKATPWLHERLKACRQRDEIARTRPEGCVCLGAGVFRDEGRPTFCACDEGRLAEAEQVRSMFLFAWTSARVPLRLYDCTFEGHANADANRDLIERMSEPEPEEESAREAWLNRSWYLHGPFGRGKSGLAISYMRQRLKAIVKRELPGPHMFLPVPDLLTDLRSTYNRQTGDTEEQIIERYAGIEFLILDDLGAEQVSGTGWVEDRLYQIIGKRHAEMRPTIFTSNDTIKATAARIGERLTWRIVEMCGRDRIAEVRGRNLRAEP